MAEYAEMSIARQSRWVDALWTLSASGSTRRILPDGCIDFIFDLSSGRARVVGSMTTSQVIDTSAGAHCFGVRFAPGAAAAFLGEPASALTDTDADLDELTRARFDAHIAACEHCAAYLEQMRETIRVVGTITVDDLTPDMERDLLAAFRAWKAEDA